MSKSSSAITTSKQISIQKPTASINAFSKLHATQTTPNKLSHPASSSESVTYALPSLSLTTKAKLIKHLVKRVSSRYSLQRDANPHKNRPTPFVTSFNPALSKISSGCKETFLHPPVFRELQKCLPSSTS